MVLVFPQGERFIFPFPGCNRLRALPSGESVDCPSLQRLSVYPHPPQHRRDRGEDFGLDVSFCSDAIWLSSTCPMKDAFLGLSLVIFLRVWWSLCAGELEKEAWNFPCPQWLCSLSPAPIQPPPFINCSYLSQAASAPDGQVCKSRLFLQASVSLDFSWLVSSIICFLMCSRKVANLQLVWLVFIIVLKA